MPILRINDLLIDLKMYERVFKQKDFKDIFDKVL